MDEKELLKSLINIDKEVKETEAKLNKLKEERETLKGQAKTIFEQLGVKSLKVEGKTVYLLKQIWAGAADGPLQVVDALQKLGLNSFVGFNTMSLSSYVREAAKENGLVNEDGDIVADEARILQILPPELQSVVKISERIDLRIRTK